MTIGRRKLWTSEEDATCKRLYPDYKALTQALPDRTRKAIEFHCQQLGITKKLLPFTAREVSDLRRSYKSATLEELAEKFPRRSRISLQSKAEKLQLHRPRKPYSRSGDMLLDELRSECFRRNISMRDLDDFAQSGRYFYEMRWRANLARLDYRHIVKAIKELGGVITVRWDPADG
jgi:hypothetical protein